MKESSIKELIENSEKKVYIFAVDNNPTILKNIQKYFKKQKNIVLDVFQDSTKAHKMFKKKVKTSKKYNLAIIDWNMPKITGDILSVMLKDLDPTIKTVLYTGSEDDVFIKHLHNYKFDAVLSKKDGILVLKEVSRLLAV